MDGEGGNIMDSDDGDNASERKISGEEEYEQVEQKQSADNDEEAEEEPGLPPARFAIASGSDSGTLLTPLPTPMVVASAQGDAQVLSLEAARQDKG